MNNNRLKTTKFSFRLNLVDIKPYAFGVVLSAVFTNKYLPVSTLTNLIGSSWGESSLFSSLINVMEVHSKFEFITNEDVRINVNGATTTIQYDPTVYPSAKYYYSTDELLDIIMNYKRINKDFNKAKTVGKSWHNIPTNPKKFKEKFGDVREVIWDPTTDKLTVIDKDGKEKPYEQ